MVDVMMFILTIVALVLVYYLYQWWAYRGPPHVIGLPLVGYMPFLGKELYLEFEKLVKKHGPIFSLYMGSLYTVVLNNYDVVREAYIEKGTVFNSRPSYIISKVYNYETAFLYVDGEDWKVTRNFTMNTLKNMGFGRNYTKHFVQTEIHRLISELQSRSGIPMDVEPILSRSTNMLIMRLLTGRKCDNPNDVRHQADITSTARQLMQSYSYDIMGLFPWLRKLSFLNILTVKKITRDLKKRFWKLLEEEMRTYKTTTLFSSSEPESFIQAWYLEQERRNKKDDPQKHLFSDFNLKNNVDVLIQASADTTSTTLMWALLYLIVHPDIQEKLHQEIDEHIGQNREPCMDDNMHMNYTRAFLTEVHRKATVVPNGPFHSNKVKSTIKGYEIPKNAVIVTNFWGIHHDPKYFPEPFKFHPGRFLDESQKFKPCEYVDPFSFGRRVCPGKQVAEMQIFLYLVSILQVFELRSPSGKMPNVKECVYDLGLIRHPVPFEIAFCERNK